MQALHERFYGQECGIWGGVGRAGTCAPLTTIHADRLKQCCLEYTRTKPDRPTQQSLEVLYALTSLQGIINNFLASRLTAPAAGAAAGGCPTSADALASRGTLTSSGTLGSTGATAPSGWRSTADAA